MNTLQNLKFAIDVFSVFRDRLWLSGWLFSNDGITSVALRGPGIAGGQIKLESFGSIPSPDVEQVFGPSASKARFDEGVAILPSQFSVDLCNMVVIFANRETFVIENLGSARNQRAPMLEGIFSDTMKRRPEGALLEVGSRARSGITRRNLVPDGWHYTGLDITGGPNVDKVGDAHSLSKIFPEKRFDAVMAFSVLEHLLMPWKFIIELNAVLADGAVGIFTTHQCWPIHDSPWDFWRFSDRAWDGLLNVETGFEIIETSMGEPAYVVAQRCHAVTNFGVTQGGFLASNVLFRKIGTTRLKWDVELNGIVRTSYPRGEVARPVG